MRIQGGPTADQAALLLLPLRQLGGQRRFVLLQLLRQLRGPFGLLPFLFRTFRRQLLFVSHQSLLRRRDRGLALRFQLSPLSDDLLLTFLDRGLQTLMVGIDALHHGEYVLNLFISRGTVEYADENLIHQLAVVRFTSDQLSQFVIAVRQRVGDRRTAHQRHHRSQLHVVRAFAFAGTFTRRPAEGTEEPAGQIDARVHQGGGPYPAGQARRRARHTLNRVVQHLGRE